MKINFESSTFCNAECIMCPRLSITRMKGEMDEKLFKKIIKEGKEMGIRQYSPFLMGEPFIFPKIWQWLDYMEKEGVQVALYTNAEYLDVDRIIKYKNIRYITCSLNAVTKETHEKVMRGPKFEIVKKNIDELFKKAPFMVRVSFVMNEKNIHEVEEFKKMFKRTEVVGYSNWTGDKDSSFERAGKRIPCWVLSHQITILVDGTVVPCCMDYNAKQPLGNVNEQSLKEIWNNASWMREKHRKYEFDSIPVCKNCNYNVPNKI